MTASQEKKKDFLGGTKTYWVFKGFWTTHKGFWTAHKGVLFLARIVLIFFMVPGMGLWFRFYAENSVDNTSMSFPSSEQFLERVKAFSAPCREPGGDVTGTADPTWPRRCSIWHHAQPIKLWVEGGNGGTVRIMAFVFWNHHFTWLSPVFLEIAKHSPSNRNEFCFF